MTQTAEHTMAQALALRDFFAASGAGGRAAAVCALGAGRDGPGQELGASAARELDFEFNRLFVGPDTVLAPPFASVYLEKEPQLMGASTLEVRELYRALGLAVPDRGVPDDFLAYELEAWVRLCALEGKTSDEQDLQSVREARSWLVLEHMARWLPAFCARAAAASPSPLMAAILKTLETWLCAARKTEGEYRV